MDKQLEQLISERNVIMIMKFGSHLYGTDTPGSDTDYKGIFIPTKDEILLQKCPKSINITPKKIEQGVKNGVDDVDIELYSLQYFLELCLKGETVAIDMLHVNSKNIVYQNTVLWDFIQGERSRFYSKDLSVLVGYCRKQAAKYGIKGSRISDARKVLEYLNEYVSNDSNTMEYYYQKMFEVWKGLPTGEHIKFVKGGKDNTEEFYQVCGKKLQKTSKIKYVIDQLETFIDRYGARALLAEQNKGLDWKSLSHAMRYALQLQELFLTKDLSFPLDARKYLTRIKLGELDYKTEVAPNLDKIIEDVEKLAETSDFPKRATRKFWDEFIKDYYKNIINS